MSIRIAVDVAACQGYACCMMEAPALFDIDDETDKAVVLVAEAGDEATDRARAAERACPARAVSIQASV
jgi:ferredoxin